MTLKFYSWVKAKKKKKKRINSKKYVHPTIHSSVIKNCQDVEAT